MLSVRLISHELALTCHSVTVTLSPAFTVTVVMSVSAAGRISHQACRSKSFGLEGSLYSSTPAWMSEVSVLLAPSTPTHSATWSYGGVPGATLGTVKVPFTTVNGPPVVEYPDQFELWVGAGGVDDAATVGWFVVVGTTFLTATGAGASET